VNLVTASSSSETMGPLIADQRLRKLSFTGSTEVGRKLMEQASQNLLRLSMELGGNAPFIVFDDADVDAAVQGAMIAKMRNIGEACTAANRFHVADKVAEEFAEKLAEKMGSLKVGRGTEDGVEVGPLIDNAQRTKVAELVEDALGRGAKAVVGGHTRDGAGYFFDPTVLTDVPQDAKLLKEEIFGPVAPIKGFTDEDEAIAAANDTEYGLVAYATRTTSSARCAWSSDSKPAWSGSTRAWSPMPAPRSAVSSSPALDERADTKVSRNTSRPSTSQSTSK
jgi:succinate-semialdehyde dehydrogenase/glutarate-semialdehyde dehydrogenase